MTPQDVNQFWLSQEPQAWFIADPEFDKVVIEKFGEALAKARAGDYDDWMETAEGCLGLIILLDQFSRNIHRGTQEAFAGDAKALALAKQAVETGLANELPVEQLSWIYMPYMHSEDMADQEKSLELFSAKGFETNAPHAVTHADIIRQFGRFPHRNKIFNRTSTAEEIQFLADGGFSG